MWPLEISRETCWIRLIVSEPNRVISEEYPPIHNPKHQEVNFWWDLAVHSEKTCSQDFDIIRHGLHRLLGMAGRVSVSWELGSPASLASW